MFEYHFSVYRSISRKIFTPSGKGKSNSTAPKRKRHKVDDTLEKEDPIASLVFTEPCLHQPSPIKVKPSVASISLHEEIRRVPLKDKKVLEVLIKPSYAREGMHIPQSWTVSRWKDYLTERSYFKVGDQVVIRDEDDKLVLDATLVAALDTMGTYVAECAPVKKSLSALA